MTAVDELITFIRHQLDDEEQAAQECIAEVGAGRVGEMYDDGSGPIEQDQFPHYPYGSGPKELTFARGPGHPARVLAEVAAKRAILDRYESLTRLRPANSTTARQRRILMNEYGLRILPALAKPCAGRPGWRQEWDTPSNES